LPGIRFDRAQNREIPEISGRSAKLIGINVALRKTAQGAFHAHPHEREGS
jgi:hypothetical protein